MIVEISVIIPVYNGEKKINISLNSLLSQTYTDFEVIIINDGSTDNTISIINEYYDRLDNLTVISQNNLGVSVARNRGIMSAKGKYICFLDADDFYNEAFLETLVNKIKQTDSQVCFCGYNLVTPNNTQIKKSIFPQKKHLQNYILGKMAVHTSGWMIERELLIKNNILFLEGVSWGEDFEFFCEVLSFAENTTFVRGYFTNYRIGFEEDQLSSFTIDKVKKDRDSIFRLINNVNVNNHANVTKSLINFRLQALITYRLLQAFDNNVKNEIIINYYEQFQKHLSQISYVNGLRSVRLELKKLILRLNIRKLKV